MLHLHALGTARAPSAVKRGRRRPPATVCRPRRRRQLGRGQLGRGQLGRGQLGRSGLGVGILSAISALSRRYLGAISAHLAGRSRTCMRGLNSRKISRPSPSTRNSHVPACARHGASSAVEGGCARDQRHPTAADGERRQALATGHRWQSIAAIDSQWPTTIRRRIDSFIDRCRPTGAAAISAIKSRGNHSRALHASPAER